jgi:hypothetical protein
MNLFVRLVALVFVGSTSVVAAQSPRLSIELGGGHEITNGEHYAHNYNQYFSATAALRVAQVNGIGLQLIGTQTVSGSGDFVAGFGCFPDPKTGPCPVARTDASGTRTTLGIAAERPMFRFLALRAGASVGWFGGSNTLGSGAHAYPVFAEAIVPLLPHVAAFGTLETTYLRDLGGDDITMRAQWFGLRIF